MSLVSWFLIIVGYILSMLFLFRMMSYKWHSDRGGEDE